MSSASTETYKTHKLQKKLFMPKATKSLRCIEDYMHNIYIVIYVYSIAMKILK